MGHLKGCLMGSAAALSLRTPTSRLLVYISNFTRAARAQAQGAPKGRQQKGETGPGTHIFADFCRFSLIFGPLCKSRDLGVADLRRKPQETADFRRKPQKTAVFLQKPVSPICCLSFGALLQAPLHELAIDGLRN